jgi:hypothetical protein
MNNKCIYFVEGTCEKQLISALKEAPAKLVPGKIKVFNTVQNIIPKSQILSIQSGTMVVLVFDTDTNETTKLKKNIELLKRYCGKIKIIFLAQVLNLEDELVRCSDVKVINELTKSDSTSNFKTDFCRMKIKDCRLMLKRHNLDCSRLWTTKVPKHFAFIENNCSNIKIK